ncbi:TPA: hypothetical protein ACGQUH_000884 [Serratia liquefaciens]|nr:hypothetical protein [Serratia liquefaciens]
MPMNKQSELSKPVDICNWKMDSWRAAPCNGTEWAKGYFEGWNKYHQKVEGLAPIYSQEYVSALLAGLEASKKSNAFLKEQLSKLANFNPDWDMLEACRESWREVAAALKEAEAKLATPIKIVDYDEFFICHVSGASDDYCKGWVDGRNAAARDVGKAGFTVEGDE